MSVIVPRCIGKLCTGTIMASVVKAEQGLGNNIGVCL